MNTRTEREKERERRTVWHADDFLRIPFWEISVERRGFIKRYKKRYQKKSSLKGKIDKYKCVWRSEYIIIQNMFMNQEQKEREREGRTHFHVGDFICIPFWEISVELIGILKRYKKRYQKKSSLKGKID